MKCLERILIVGGIIFLIICCFLQPNNIKQSNFVQQLIDLEIVVSKQTDTIKLQAAELEESEIKYKEIYKTALEVAGENYALHKVIDDMTISLKQMFEYIQRLEEELKDRDA